MTIITDPIQWHEGMLLMPQHFQQNDIRQDRLRALNQSSSQPFHWGVIHMELDAALLAAGTFRPTALEVMMPDGLYVQDALEHGATLELDLTASSKDLQARALRVWLCVPELRGDSSDVLGAIPRYRSVDVPMQVDENTDEDDVSIPRLAPNLSLVLGDQPPAHYVGIPIAEVSYDTKTFALTNFVPPLLDVAHNQNAMQLVQNTAAKLREKLGYLQQKVQGAPDMGSTEQSYLQDIESARLKIISGLLPLEAVLGMKHAHPGVVFLLISGVVGNLAGIRFGEMPPRFDDYDHNNIMLAFSPLIDFIDNVLDGIQETYAIHVFDKKDRLFSLKLDPSWVGTELVLGVRAQPGMTDDELTRWIQNVVIDTDKYVETAKDNRILGADRTIVDEVPTLNLVSKRGSSLFTVQYDPEFIDPQGVLCLFNLSDTDQTRPAEVVLYNANMLATTQDQG